jgi:hypothetical protein
MVGVVGIFPSEPLDHVARAWVTDRAVVRLAASECNRRLVACPSHVEAMTTRYLLGSADWWVRLVCCLRGHQWGTWMGFTGFPGEGLSGEMRTCCYCGRDECVETTIRATEASK